MEKLKVAVIGAGHLGSHHARLYITLPNVELVGACDTNIRRAKKIARRYRTSFYEDYRQFIGKIDAASIDRKSVV